MMLNMHVYKVSCMYNNDRREYLVVAHDYNSAERQVLDRWSASPPSASYLTLSISNMGAFVDVTGMQIHRD